MPIRFRCAYCNQLMGIARRKAGSVVSCPGCQRQLVVPTPNAQQAQPMALPPVPTPTKPNKPSPFDRHDFDAGLFDPQHPKTPDGPIHHPTMQASSSQEFDVQPVALPLPGPVAGTPLHAFGSTALYWWLLLIGALALAAGSFGAGFAVGRLR
jgi:hypothetical protein